MQQNNILKKVSQVFEVKEQTCLKTHSTRNELPKSSSLKLQIIAICDQLEAADDVIFGQDVNSGRGYQVVKYEFDSSSSFRGNCKQHNLHQQKTTIALTNP